MLKKSARCFVVIIVIITTVPFFAFAEKPSYYAAPEAVGLSHEIVNFHVVDPDIMRGSHPSGKALALLKEYAGVKTILSLHDKKQDNEWEKQAAEKLGITFINIPMNGIKEQDIGTIERCLKIIDNKANQPIFVHCYEGKDRTGMVFAAYRIKYDHWSFSDAFNEMLGYGYHRVLCYNLKKSLVRWNSAQNHP